MNIRRERRRFSIPLDSMSDVAFILLIFIMFLSLVNYRQEIKIEYPEAETAKKTDVEKNLEIWIDRAGELYLDGSLSDLETIENSVIEAYQDAPNTRVHVIADRNTQFEKVNNVLQTLQILQYRVVSLVVR
ncbi:MAG: biopolymer transporter ExbD [Treponema sp.]|nr:biopolymer transporter ExbD [Treponema sp.]